MSTVSTERSHKSKGGRGELFLYGGTESTHITVVVDVGTFGSVGCVAQFPSMASSALTNQLALSPGSPARPPNSGDKVRFVLRLTW